MVSLYEHQENALERLGNGKVLVGGVGTGKSLTALAYYVKRESPKDIYIVTTARKRDEMDWEREASLLSISPTPGIGKHGVLHVDSWNNIKKYKDVRDAFFIFDEQRVVGTGAWAKAFIQIAKRNRWILLSATPGDTWLDYMSVFIANGYYKNATEFRRKHVVYSYYGGYPKLERYLGVGELTKHRDEILVEMPFVRHTQRHLKTVKVSYDKKKFKEVTKTRQDPEDGEPFQNAAAFLTALRKIANGDESRLDAVRQLWETHPRLIVFYNFDYELEQLRKLPGAKEWNGHRHDPVPKGERWVYLVQYVAGAEAWNCVSTNAMVFYSLTYSYKNFEQAQGRIDRLNTKYFDLYYYILVSDSPVDRAVKNALDQKKDFNERAYLKQLTV
nr:MAG TPA: Chromatin remodeling complex ATPase [Caudoviricetes sp.]